MWCWEDGSWGVGALRQCMYVTVIMCAPVQVVFAGACTLVRPDTLVAGALTIRNKDFYFIVDETAPTYQTATPSVRVVLDSLSGRWTAQDIAGVLPRRHLLKRVGVEVFLHDRTTLFFAFPTAAGGQCDDGIHGHCFEMCGRHLGNVDDELC